MMDATSASQKLTERLGPPLQDASEETFVLFAQELPPNNLGMVDQFSGEITVEIGNRDITLQQSVGLLTSNRGSGTTGAALWKISPLLANWLIDTDGLLWTAGILHPQASVIELGCGISGLLGIALGPLVSSYLLTDQEYVMKGLRHNIEANMPPTRSAKGRQKKGRIDVTTRSTLPTLALDWEQESPRSFEDMTGVGNCLDLVMACDCVYNDFLLKPFIDTCTELCKTDMSNRDGPVLLVAQQLRSDTVFEKWLEGTMRDFRIWRVADEYLPVNLRSSSGYVVHLSMLKVDKESD